MSLFHRLLPLHLCVMNIKLLFMIFLGIILMNCDKNHSTTAFSSTSISPNNYKARILESNKYHFLSRLSENRFRKIPCSVSFIGKDYSFYLSKHMYFPMYSTSENSEFDENDEDVKGNEEEDVKNKENEYDEELVNEVIKGKKKDS